MAVTHVSSKKDFFYYFLKLIKIRIPDNQTDKVQSVYALLKSLSLSGVIIKLVILKKNWESEKWFSNMMIIHGIINMCKREGVGEGCGR